MIPYIYRIVEMMTILFKTTRAKSWSNTTCCPKTDNVEGTEWEDIHSYVLSSTILMALQDSSTTNRTTSSSRRIRIDMDLLKSSSWGRGGLNMDILRQDTCRYTQKPTARNVLYGYLHLFSKWIIFASPSL